MMVSCGIGETQHEPTAAINAINAATAVTTATNGLEMQSQDADGQEEDDANEVDINIANVVTNFNTCCHLNLRQIANLAANVIYKREQAMVSMKLRTPRATASIWSSGKVMVTGPTSEEEARKASRRVARILQKLGFKVRFVRFRIVNVLGIVNLPFGIRIAQFTEQHRTVCRSVWRPRSGRPAG